MAKVDNGGDAFPAGVDGGGMTLRDYFAAKAITGESWNTEQEASEIAKRVYRLADAMLKEREL